MVCSPAGRAREGILLSAPEHVGGGVDGGSLWELDVRQHRLHAAYGVHLGGGPGEVLGAAAGR